MRRLRRAIRLNRTRARVWLATPLPFRRRTFIAGALAAGLLAGAALHFYLHDRTTADNDRASLHRTDRKLHQRDRLLALSMRRIRLLENPSIGTPGERAALVRRSEAALRRLGVGPSPLERIGGGGGRTKAPRPHSQTPPPHQGGGQGTTPTRPPGGGSGSGGSGSGKPAKKGAVQQTVDDTVQSGKSILDSTGGAVNRVLGDLGRLLGP